jgi:hypothetical protein
MPSTNGVGAADRPHHHLTLPAGTRTEPGISDSIIRLFEAGQRVVLDRVDLARFDLAQLAATSLRAAAFVGVGAVVLSGAWFAVLAAAVIWAAPYVSLPAALAGAGLASLVAGALLIAAGVKRARDLDDLTMPGMRRPLSESRRR